MRQRVLIIASVLLLAGGLTIPFRISDFGFRIRDKRLGLSSVEELGIEKTNLQIDNPQGTLTVSGSIAADEIVISTEVSGRVQALYADEGEEVKAGQVLAQLDTAMLDGQIQGAQAEVQAAQARLAEAKAGARPEEVQIAEAAVLAAREGIASAEKAVVLAQGNVAAAQAALQAAQAELDQVQAGPSDYDIALAEAELELAQQRLRVAWSVRDSVGGSQQRGEVPEGSYNAARAAVAQAEVRVRLAELKLEDLKAGPRAEDVQAAQAAVDAAQARVDAAQAQVAKAERQLDAAQARLRQAQAHLELAKAGATPEQLAMAGAQVSQAQAALKILQVQRDKMTLHAPRDGLVLERSINVGERALPGGILFHLGNLERVRLTVYVPGTALGRVYVGQPADVTVDALPGRAFQGRVVHIAAQAEFTPRNIQTREQRVSQVYAVKIEIPNPDRVLKPGMAAEAVFGDGR